MYRILMVEDDDALAVTTSAFLESEGFEVETNSGKGAYEAVIGNPPDLLLLDVELPEETGLSICKRVRESFKGPIVMLTARDSDMDEIVGFELGADEYFRKPVHTRLLILRIHALLRRHEAPAGRSEKYLYEDVELRVDRASREVTVRGQHVDMTTAEFDLLWYMVERLGEPVSRDDYYAEVKGVEYDGLDRSFDNSVSRIRRKLMETGLSEGRIVTIRGMGYQLTPLY
jgi:DNA-binding response OmpR family regulator